MAYANRLFLKMVHETGKIGRVAMKPTQAMEDGINAGLHAWLLEGTKFEGNDAEWDEYIRNILPTAEDEEALLGYFEMDWIANKPLSARQLESGIGASA